MMLAMSAMPGKLKRNVLTQEVVRLRRNISLDLPWETTVKHLNDFSARMRASGYGERYRLDVIKSEVEGFENMVAEEKNGGRPINQRRTWNEVQRQKKKELQKKNWFTRGGFDVPLFVEWRTSQENERGRGPKLLGQKNWLQNCGERRCYFGKFAEKIEPMV